MGQAIGQIGQAIGQMGPDDRVDELSNRVDGSVPARTDQRCNAETRLA